MENPTVPTVLLFNPDVTAGTMIHSVCGRSGLCYGKSRFDGRRNGHIFEIPAESYFKDRNKIALDIARNTAPLQLWLVVEISAPAAPVVEKLEPDDDAAETAKLFGEEFLSLLLPHDAPEDKSPADTLRRLIVLAEAAQEDIALAQTDGDEVHDAETLALIEKERVVLMGMPLPKLKEEAAIKNIDLKINKSRGAIVEAMLADQFPVPQPV